MRSKASGTRCYRYVITGIIFIICCVICPRRRPRRVVAFDNSIHGDGLGRLTSTGHERQISLLRTTFLRGLGAGP